MMMKGGKEEDKRIMEPLFPRLHVKDADRGGPRAPPRNKMALYEQLSTPSQRFSYAAPASTLPLPPYNAGASVPVPSASPSQGGSHESSVFSPFYMHHSPAQSAEMVQSRTFDANNYRSTRMELVRRSAGHANQKSSNAAASVVEFSSFRSHDFSNRKSSCEEKFDDKDDFTVPTFLHSDTTHSTRDTFVMETKRSTPLHANSPHKNYSATLNSSIQFPSSYDKPLEQASADPKSRKHKRNHTEHKSKESVVIKGHKEVSVSNLETGEELAVNSGKESSDEEQTSTRNFIEKPCQGNTGVCLESCGNGAINEPGCLNATNDAVNGDSLVVKNESCSKNSFGNDHRSSNMSDDCNSGSDDKVDGSEELEDADRNNEASETSMVEMESIPGLEISPDDVVGEIGPKQFWKARRAIVNQQRVFAVQVFELHRLIKVQKLIAASPNLLLEENPYLSGSPQKVTDKNLPPEPSAKPQPLIVKRKDHSQKPSDNTVVPPLPSRDDGPNKSGLRQLLRCAPYTGDPPPSISAAPEHKQTSWCYPSTNQWLVPVISPSEGLIYKPYTGHCSPAAGFMAPFHGSCGPLSLPLVAGDLMNAAYGTPAIAPNYFQPPYGFPVVNPIISALPVEQVGPIAGSRPAVQIEQWSRSSLNMAIPRSEAFSGYPWKVPTSKDSELQGSTASSPCERAHAEGRDAPPLIPTRVIKVVPRNARSATESVTRIFQSIQEERQQYEP